jgi:hypothetical protein
MWTFDLHWPICKTRGKGSMPCQLIHNVWLPCTHPVFLVVYFLISMPFNTYRDHDGLPTPGQIRLFCLVAHVSANLSPKSPSLNPLSPFYTTTRLEYLHPSQLLTISQLFLSALLEFLVATNGYNLMFGFGTFMVKTKQPEKYGKLNTCRTSWTIARTYY